jgi:hypothetical protein
MIESRHEHVDQFFTGLFGVFLCAVLIALALYWLLFPMLVLFKLNDILKSNRKTEEHLRTLRSSWVEQTKRTVAPD